MEETENEFDSEEGARVNVSLCHEIGSVPFVEEEVGSGDNHWSTSEAFVRSRRSWKVRIWMYISVRMAVRGPQKVEVGFIFLLCIILIFSYRLV